MIDEILRLHLTQQGFLVLREMPDGSIAGVSQYLFTFGLCTKLDVYGYDSRYCFKDVRDAALSLSLWDGNQDPPGPWIKQKYPVERHNPKLYTHKGGTWYERNETHERETW